MERSKEKSGGDEERKCALFESSPESTHSLCKPCHALLPQNSLPEGLPIDTTSLQEAEQSNYNLTEDIDFYRQLLVEKDPTSLQEAEQSNCNLTEAIDFYRQLLVEKDHELRHLQSHLRQLERRSREDNEKVQAYQEECRDLHLKLERAENLISQQSMADSGSYQDSAATPPLLQGAADSVKDAIAVCASELFSRIKKNSLPINLACMNLHSKETGQIIKFALQSVLCHILFIGFEYPFVYASNGLPPFEKPAKRKTHFLQVYKHCRDLDARQMVNEETDFALFFSARESNLYRWVKEQLLMTDDVQKKEEFMTSEVCSRNNHFYSKLLRLVKAVWVLHKLAFAFEPSAEIFRVGQGSVLDEEFMEDVAEDEDEDDHEDEKIAESSKMVKQVRFMCVPGFTVRHTIIKSRVFSLKESQHCICSLNKDPSPMTVDSVVSES